PPRSRTTHTLPRAAPPLSPLRTARRPPPASPRRSPTETPPAHDASRAPRPPPPRSSPPRRPQPAAPTSPRSVSPVTSFSHSYCRSSLSVTELGHVAVSGIVSVIV